MAKYEAKGEPRLQSVQSIFKSFIDCLIDNSDTCKLFKSAMIHSVGEKDFSSHETCGCF